MSCRRYHLDRPVSDEEFDKLMGELLGEAPQTVGDRPLDDIFASRSHVRVLRVLCQFGDEVNLTGRDIARRTGLSHTRVQQVLSQLVATRLVTRYSEATWAIFEIDKSSPLAQPVRSLLEQERQLTSP